MKQVLTKEEVAKAVKDLEAQGKKVTYALLHAALGNRGSMSTLLKLKAEIEGTALPVTDSPAGLKVFRELWTLAVTEGRQHQETTIVQLREEVKALATENERLDGLAIEFEQAKEAAGVELERVGAELKTLQTDLVKATEQTKQVLSTLAEERAAHAKELTLLRQEITAELRKFHELELKLARSEMIEGADGKMSTRKNQKDQGVGDGEEK